jgi:preprotein translocase subunit YajC
MKRPKPKKGDVIALAGGLKVTVEKVEGDHMDVVWWETGNGYMRATIPVKAARPSDGR